MSSNIRELELDEQIFRNINKALLQIERWEKKEIDGRDNIAASYQPAIDSFIPVDETKLTYNYQTQMKASSSIAFASAEAKYELLLWDKALTFALGLRAPNPRLLRKILINMASCFKGANMEHVTVTYGAQLKAMMALAHYQTEASSHHQQLLEGRMSKDYRMFDEQLKKKGEKKKETTAKDDISIFLHD